MATIGLGLIGETISSGRSILNSYGQLFLTGDISVNSSIGESAYGGSERLGYSIRFVPSVDGFEPKLASSTGSSASGASFRADSDVGSAIPASGSSTTGTAADAGVTDAIRFMLSRDGGTSSDGILRFFPRDLGG